MMDVAPSQGGYPTLLPNQIKDAQRQDRRLRTIIEKMKDGAQGELYVSK